MPSIEDFIRAFEARTLTRAEWTHQALLEMALWYSRTYSRQEAARKITGGIQRLNAALGIVQTPQGGYHETITRFYIHMIGRFAERENEEQDWNKLTTLLMQAYGAIDLPLQYYSKERLNSREARTGWVEPDLRELP